MLHKRNRQQILEAVHWGGCCAGVVIIFIRSRKDCFLTRYSSDICCNLEHSHKMSSIFARSIRINATAPSRLSANVYRRFFTIDSVDAVKSAEEPTSVKADWFVIGGFTRFASRRDLEMIMGTQRILKVDPILDANCCSTGKWAVLLPAIHITALRTNIIPRNSKVTATPLSKDDFNHLKLASRSGITECTVRFKNVPNEIGIDELRFFLQEYNLEDSPNAILPFQMDHKKQSSQQFLVNFASPEDAERVVLEKCFTLLEGTPVQMMWYNC